MEADREHDPLATPPRPGAKRFAFRMAVLVVWGAVLGIVVNSALSDPSVLGAVLAVALLALFVLVYAQLFLVQWGGTRSWRRALSKVHGSLYVSGESELPNRNYLLSELRREMPRARTDGTPFTLLVFSFETIDEIRERRGDDFADRSIRALVELLRRVTRHSDFVAHLGAARFCVMLTDCIEDQAVPYLRRVPGSIAVSDGRDMYDVPITARMSEYDLESLYATDVLRDCEEAPPLKRQEQAPRFNTRAA